MSRFSGVIVYLRSRLYRVDRGMLYIFDTRMMFIVLVERIVSIVKMILASWVCIDIMLLLCRGAIESGGRDAMEKVAGRP